MAKEITEKLSFAEMQADRDAVLHNSNLENLSTALMNLKQERQAIDKKLKNIGKLEDEINELARRIEAGELVDMGEVRDLYEKARGTNLQRL